MKKISSKIMSIAAVAMLLISCGGGGEVHEISTESVKLSGTHSKYIAVEGNHANLKFIPGNKRNELVPSIDVTFALDEVPDNVEDYKMAFNQINISLCDKDGKRTKLGVLHTVSDNAKKFKKLLGGSAGKTTTVTFVGEDGCSKDSLEVVMAEISSFKVDNIELSRSELYWNKSLDAMERALDVIVPLTQKMKYDSGNLSLMVQCAQYGQAFNALNNELLKASENKELSSNQQKRYDDLIASAAKLL